MNRERLEHLIDVLLEVDRKERGFSLETWAGNINSVMDCSLVHAEPNTCGTACCALGYAALDPQFRREGLKLFVRAQGRGWHVGQLLDRTHSTMPKTVDISFVDFHGYQHFYAAAVFFGIEEETAKWLFHPSRYDHNRVKPIDVRRRVRYVLANGEADYLPRSI
jgi:hypothetical protein